VKGDKPMSDKEMNNEPEQVRIKERPMKTFRAGAVSSAVWRRTGTGKDGQETVFWSVTFDKRYRDKEGKWESSRFLNANDIPKAILALQQAYSYVICEAATDDNLPF